MNNNTFRGQYEFTVQGKAYVTNLNMNAIRIMCSEENISVSDLETYLSEKPLDGIPKMVYYGVLNQLRIKGSKTEVFDFERFCALALNEEGMFEKMTEWVTQSLGGDVEKKTRAARRKAATTKK